MVDDGANVREEVSGGRGVKNSTCAQASKHGEDSRAIPAPRRQERTIKARKFMQLDLSFTSWFFGLLFLILFLVMPLTVVALRNRKAFRCFQSSYKRSVSLD